MTTSAMAQTDEAEFRRLLLDQIAEGVAVVDATGDAFTIVEANRALQGFAADRARPLLGRAWRDAFPQAAERGMLDAFRRVAASGEPHVARNFFVSQVAAAHAAWQPEALAFWDWRCLPLRDAGGEVARLLVTLADVTERLLQERGRGLNAKILEHMPIGIATTTGEGHIITLANARFARFAGVPAPDLLGRPLGAALPAGQAGGFADLLDRVYRTGSPFSVDEFAFQPAAGGAPAFWNLVVMPLPGLRDATGGLMLMAVDITDQARARREVEGLAAAAAQRAGQLEAVIGSMVDGVFLLDARGLVIEANEAGLALLGLPAAVTSQRLSEYLAPLAPRRADGRSLAPDVDLLDGVLAGRVLPDEQLVLGPPGEGERVISLSGAPVREGDGQIGGAVVMLRDVSERRRLDQEKDAFLSLISHEVKSPLTAIKGFAQLAGRAADHLEGGDRVTRHLVVIGQQVERIERLVNELAEASRLQKGALRQEPVEFNLAALLRAVVEQQQVTTTSHALRLTVADEPLPVRADPARVEQVLANLLANAVKYSPGAEQVAVTLARDAGDAHLRVRDEGIGIPRAEQGRLFGRFYRASNTGGGPGGLGLGLFISHEIVVQSGGRIWVESAENQGSTFHVTLPLSNAECGITARGMG